MNVNQFNDSAINSAVAFCSEISFATVFEKQNPENYR